MAAEYTVAVINSNEDIVQAIQLMLSEEGFHSVGAHVIDFKHGRKDFVAFCQEYNPQVILFDIAPPYEENWNFFQLLKNTQVAAERAFIVTTTNTAALEKVVGETVAIEILGKPFEMEEMLTAIHNKLKH